MEKENFDNCIGKKIRNLRHKINWSQGEVAVQMNISIPAFSKIENGITDINIKRLNQIANLLGVSAHELLRGVQKEFLDVKSPSTVITELKEAILQREQDIIKIQKKLIDLYEEAENLNKERLKDQ